MNAPELITLSDGARVAISRSGNAKGPRVLLSHGNGFAVGAFAALLSALEAEHNCFALDLRNHGCSPLHELAHHTHTRHVHDVGEVLDYIGTHYGDVPIHGVMHSISGVFSLGWCCQSPEAFATLTLMEPPLALPSMHELGSRQRDIQMNLGATTLRRKQRFDSPEEFVARYAARPAFTKLDSASMLAYARAILRPDDVFTAQSDEPSWVLACPAQFESALYIGNIDHGDFDRLPRLNVPVQILASDADDLRANIAKALAHQGRFGFERIPDSTHLMPLECPQDIALLAVDFIRREVGS